jgi:glycosyltransferase involved in cell wall biosynthesis
MAADRAFVSVIVPVYNDRRRIVTCIRALLAQTYPRDRYEVIVVDNGSTDGTAEVAAREPVTVLVERRIRTSYAARNRGLSAAKGEVIAFTDADCTPSPRWLEAGVGALEAHGADLAGGAVRFVASARPSGAEVYDSISNMQQERSIGERGVAKTANLMVRAAVFAAVGPFPAEMPSGGDVAWTGRATGQGFRLVYAPEAEVTHPTRRLLALLGKQYRVGRGRYRLDAARWLLLQADGPTPPRPLGPRGVVRSQLRRLRPPALGYIRTAMECREGSAPPPRLIRVWMAGWLSSVSTAVGAVAESLRSPSR